MEELIVIFTPLVLYTENHINLQVFQIQGRIENLTCIKCGDPGSSGSWDGFPTLPKISRRSPQGPVASLGESFTFRIVAPCVSFESITKGQIPPSTVENISYSDDFSLDFLRKTMSILNEISSIFNLISPKFVQDDPRVTNQIKPKNLYF
ncbi:hypothetical protein CDAR_98101 [Caerostris darwini]|uniref:Uncharacterized protein n=1 Tax=Caerostris darwini TaxID=1538125 RepID=A0AAV4UFP8_9ARAC|nr:hypothetical protein CDAR_98101 [Caerostris darwini]